MVNPPNINSNMIITGHSDYPILDHHVDHFNPMVWWGVNKMTNKPNVFTIPLGITNDTDESPVHRIFGNTDCMIQVMNENVEIKNLVYMNINIGTYPQERQLVWDLFKDKSWITVGNIEISIEGRTKFLRNIKEHVFVLCPRGNGLDTHRLWETLYMNRIPIVRRDIGYKEFEDLPICFINDWNEINETFLINEMTRITSKSWNLDKLKMSYWVDRIKQSII